MSILLTEKYRPTCLEDIVGLNITFPIDESLPHLLLYGPPGTGKSTLARVIIKILQCDSITLNASSERGIDIIRDKVKDFASTRSKSGSIKIIFLDEADHLTADAQTALRNTMETYAANCRFIMTANYINRIIDPLKSRCVMIKFDNIPRALILDRLQYICAQEKIPYDINALNKILDKTNCDIRSAINKIEENKDGITLDKIENETSLCKEVFALIQEKDFSVCRQLILDSHPDYEQFFIDLHNTVLSSQLPVDYKMKFIIVIADTYSDISRVAFKEILVDAMICKLIALQ